MANTTYQSIYANAVSTRQNLIDYCKRKLGFPVIAINVDDDQLNDRLDDALQFMVDYHTDTTQKVYIAHYMSSQDVARQYIDMSQLSGLVSTNTGNNYIFGTTACRFTEELQVGLNVSINGETQTIASVIDSQTATTANNWVGTNDNVPITNMTDAYNIMGVTRIFPLASNATVNMFDLRYQLRLNDLYDFTSTSYVNFVLTQQHLRTLDMLFSGENPIRFNRVLNRLFIDFQWGDDITVGQYVLIEAYKIVNPNLWNLLYNDRLFKKLCVAYVKRQWGQNLSKYKDTPMIGGVKMNGFEILQQADKECEDIEEEIKNTYQEPPTMMLG